jgi:segregation and condensation protein B
VKTLQEREWVRIVGHRDVPGRPAMYGTTRQFLDYFNLKGLDDLPTLMELRDIDTINAELELMMPGEATERPEEQDVEASDAAGIASEEAPRVVQVAVDTPESNDTIH